MSRKPANIKVIEAKSMNLLPARTGTCVQCASVHPPHLAHNAESLFYQTRFQMAHGRWPTWADACAHLEPQQRDEWREAMIGLGYTFTEIENPIAEPFEISGAAASVNSSAKIDKPGK